MKASIKWLSKYLPLEGLSPSEIASKMTLAGLEVDGVYPLAKATGLVIGEILECEMHPDSDHLHILKVDEGSRYGIHQIVCGAPNARKGLKVIVAREGAALPEVTIAKGTIRGVESDGMCCSLLELGVDKKFLSEKQISGIEELPSDAPVGEEDVLHYLSLDDTVIDFELLANRGDLLSVWNVARELSSILSLPFKLEEFPAIAEKDDSFLLQSESEKCPIFHGALLKGIHVAESPKWLKEALLSSGVRSINNIVDIGNYVMLLTGEPVNMYDLDALKEQELTVTDAFEGPFVTMDDKSLSLKKGDLVVMSGEEPVCLAGIMTSKRASVSEKTKNVVVECALFDGASIRHTANRLGLCSDSSARFVKGVSSEIQKQALEAILSLVKELCAPAEVLPLRPYDVYPHKETVIPCSFSYINSRLGTAFPDDLIVQTLQRDHIRIEKGDGDSFLAYPPNYRMDLKGKEDLSEETIRLLGYENIVSKLPSLPLSSQGGLSEKQKDVLSIRRFLRDNGLYEVLTYSLRKEGENDFLSLGDHDRYTLLNPLVEDRKSLRISLLPSLLDVASYNLSRQEKDFTLFEISDVDAKGYQGERLAILLSGEESIQGLLNRRSYDFYSVKGYLEGILSLLKLSINRFKKDTNVGPEFHPYRAERLLLGKKAVAVYGEIHPTFREKKGLPKGPLVLLEIDLFELLALKSSSDKGSIPPRFPSLTRDVAFLVDKKVPYEEIRSAISRLDKRIEDVSLFDLYEGEKVAEGKKSMALHITLRKEDGTLLEEESKETMEKVVKTLQSAFLAEIRQ